MNSQLLSKTLLQDLDDIKFKSENMVTRSSRSIDSCQKLLTTYRNKIITSGFKSPQEEIIFFKVTKQIPLFNLVYFSEIKSFELQFPRGDRKEQLKFVRKKIKKLNRFFLYNIDFGQYVISGATHFDKEYYTRDYLETFHITTSKFYFQDFEFSTPRDMLLAKLKANDSLLDYFDQKELEVLNSLKEKPKPVHQIQKIHWPFTKTDYVEMLYALHAKGLGQKDNLNIIQVSKILQQVFDFTPKDIYKTFHEMKNRKNSRTLFLDELSTSLLREMDKSDE